MSATWCVVVVAALVSVASGDVLCSGGGCRCTRVDHLHVVDCSGRGLDAAPLDPGDWPGALRDAASGAVVDLRQNRVVAVGRLPELPAVLSLSLAHNQVRSLTGAALARLANLEVLDLSHNQLTGSQIRPEIFSSKPNVTNSDSSRLLSLDLSYNNISHLNATAFGNIHNLQELRISNNPLLSLENSLQEALQALNILQVLDISSTGISAIGDDFFQVSSIKGSLREMYLSGNQLTEVPKGSSFIGATLEVLNLNRNPILELNETSFFGLRNIRRLSISEMGNLFRIAAGTFDSLVHLQILFCSSNPRLNEIDKDAFRELKSKWPIKEVYINNNSLESLSPDLLVWDEVDVLDLRDNPWNCDCRISWLPRLLTTTSASATMEMIAQHSYCDNPARWSGVSLADMPAEESAWCSEETDTGTALHRHTAPVLLAVGLLVLTALAVALICYRRKAFLQLVQPLEQPYVMIRQ